MTRAIPNDDADSASLLAELDQLQGLLLGCRAVFPTLTAEMIGQRAFSTAPYYRRRGYKAEVRLEQPITEDFIVRQRQLGRWINENALIRLYGILKHRGLFEEKEKLDKSLPGHREMDFLRRIRNVLTKTPLDYRPQSRDNQKLRNEVIQYFDLKKPDIQEHLPIPINKVIDPIFEGCRKYIRAFHESHTNKPSRRALEDSAAG